MTKKIALGIFLLVLGCLSPVAAADTAPVTLRQVNVAQIWPNKAGWLGQKAVLVPAKLYQTVSFLFLYDQPGALPSGVDQLSLGRRLSGKEYVVKGLFEQKAAKTTEYFWCLTGDGALPALWVKDNQDRTLSDQPFALESEMAGEKQAAEKLAKLTGLTIWSNKNKAVVFDQKALADHLEPLVIRTVRSDGPFGENYSLQLAREDNSLLLWKAGFGSNPSVYSLQQFYDLLQKNFYMTSPFDAHPTWSQDTWTAIKSRKVALGWNQEMVDLSWGAARETTKEKDGSETWEYPDRHFLTFKNDIVTKIKIPAPPPVKDGKPQSNQPKGIDSNLKEVPEAFFPQVDKTGAANPASQSKEK